MTGESTFQQRVLEQMRELAENPAQFEQAVAALDEPTAPNLLSDVARRTTNQVAELGEAKAEEKAVIKAAQDQVDRFDNWWGKVTGQHANAVIDLTTVEESSTARIEMIDARIEEHQGHFEQVVHGAFEEPEHETLDT